MLNTKLESIEANVLSSVTGGCGGKKQRQRGCGGGQMQYQNTTWQQYSQTTGQIAFPCNTGAPTGGQQQPPQQQPQGGGGGGWGGLRLDFSYDPQGGGGGGQQGQGY